MAVPIQDFLALGIAERSADIAPLHFFRLRGVKQVDRNVQHGDLIAPPDAKDICGPAERKIEENGKTARMIVD